MIATILLQKLINISSLLLSIFITLKIPLNRYVAWRKILRSCVFVDIKND